MSGEQEILVIEAPVVDIVELPGDVVELVEVIEPELLVLDSPAELEVIEAAAEVVELIEIAEQGPPGPPGGESMPYAKRTDFVGDEVIYKAEAQPGTADTSPAWRISRITLVGEDITEQWAGGSADFVHIWTNRESYEYA